MLLIPLAKLCKNFMCRNNNFHKTIVFPLRSNANVANTLRSPNMRIKKESVEVFKWILLVMPVTSFGLGCWQVYRLQWKLDLIKNLQSKSNAIPMDLPQNLEELDNMEYMPVKVKGEFLHDKEILIGPRPLIENDSASAKVGSLVSDPKKNQGWLVVTPFKLSDTGEVILINRGWVHNQMRSKEKRAASMINGPVELVGLVRLTEHRAPFMPRNNPQKSSWYCRDLKEMSEHLNCSPVWLDVRGVQDPPEGWPIPNQTRITLRNEHLYYVFTWFSLSAFTALMWHRNFIRKLPLV